MKLILQLFYILFNPGMAAALLVLAGRYQSFNVFPETIPGWVDATVIIAAFAWTGILYRGIHDFSAPLRIDAARIFPPGTRFFLVSVLLLGLFMLAGVLWSADPAYGLEKSVYYFIYVITWFALLINLKEREADILFKTLIAAALLLTAAALIPLVPDIIKAVTAGEPVSMNRISAIGGGPNVFSRFTSVGFLAAFGYLFGSRRTAPRILLPLLMLVLGAATYLSGSRGSFLALAVAVLVYLIVRFFLQRQHPLASIATLISVAAVFLVITFGLDMQERYRAALQDPSQQYSDRIHCAERCLELGAESPLAGWGTGSFAYHVPEAMARYPHNIYLELYAENGFAGLALFIMLLLSIIMLMVKIFRLPDNDGPVKEQACLFAALLAFALAVAQVSGDTVDSRWIWFFGFLAANLYLRARKEGNTSTA